MAVTLEVVAPIFGIILLGFVAAKLRFLDEPAVRGLVLFVFKFAIPVLLFRSLAQTDFPADIEWGFLLAFYGGGLSVYGLGYAAGRFLFERPGPDQAIFGMTTGFSNTVLIGIPIVLTAFGAEATLPLFLLVASHSPTLMPLTVALIQIGRGRAALGSRLRGLLRELAGTPLIIGLLGGIATNLAGLELPGPIDVTAAMFGAAAVPCALFAMGASLASFSLRGDPWPVLVLAPIKLVIHPLLVWTLAVPILGLEGIWVKVAVTLAAMPSGVNAYLFAARYEAAEGVAARTVLASTAVSIITISAVLYLLRG